MINVWIITTLTFLGLLSIAGAIVYALSPIVVDTRAERLSQLFGVPKREKFRVRDAFIYAVVYIGALSIRVEESIKEFCKNQIEKGI